MEPRVRTQTRSWLKPASALLLAVFVVLGLVPAPRAGVMGPNGGVRLLMHCEGPASYPGGAPRKDPCETRPDFKSTGDIRSEYDGEADTVMVWALLYNPCRFAVRGAGFGIRHEGVDVVTSGTCADLVYQDGEEMGTWAESGSEIAFAWTPAHTLTGGFLEPIAWFLLARLEPDGYFEVYSGRTPMAGAVADTNGIPNEDPIYEYGRVGFGSTPGLLPLEEPMKVAGTWGAAKITAR